MKENIDLATTRNVIDKIIDRANQFPECGEEIHEKIIRDIERQACRESGVYMVQDVNVEYLDAVYETIENYQLPAYLKDERHTP